jgi:hypothetical protein
MVSSMKKGSSMTMVPVPPGAKGQPARERGVEGPHAAVERRGDIGQAGAVRVVEMRGERRDPADLRLYRGEHGAGLDRVAVADGVDDHQLLCPDRRQQVGVFAYLSHLS